MKNDLDSIIREVKQINTKEIYNVNNSKDFIGKRVMTFGTYDLFHVGHKKIIDHALKISSKPENLFIAVSSDHWNELKGKESQDNQDERMKKILKEYPKSNVIIEDHNAPEESWPFLFDKYDIDLIIMGGDHVDNLSYINNIITPSGRKMRIIFFERTPKISSSLIKKHLIENDKT